MFATYAYHESAGVLRNGMARFETKPRHFARTPTRKVVLTRLFGGDLATISHQIGPCEVTPEGIYVTVGDGERPERGRDPTSTFGKVLRIDRNGDPAPGNPFRRQASSFPDASGASPVLAISYDTAAAYPYRLKTGMGAVRLMHAKGCFGCHSLNGRGGKECPVLDWDSLVPRTLGQVSSGAYVRSLASVDTIRAQPFIANRSARREVLAARGMDRVRVWMQHHIREPRFDNPAFRMPALGVPRPEAERITDFLLTPPERPPRPKVRYRHLAFAFAAG